MTAPGTQTDAVDRDVLVHIGYHKTATSWLQRVLFTKAGLGLSLAATKAELHPLLVDPRALDFDAADARAKLALLIDAGARDGAYPVLSSEELCGSPHTGGVYEKEFADRIAAALPRARVLIVVREQKAMLASTYKQYVRAGGTLALETYLSPPIQGDIRSCLPDWRHFRYDVLADYYRRILGEDRVLVLPFEVFRNRPDDFVHRLARFCERDIAEQDLERLPYERDVNRSLGALGVVMKRRLNPYVSRPERLYPEPWIRVTKVGHRRLVKGIRRVEGLAPAGLRRRLEQRLRRVVQEWAGDRFRASNARLDASIADDLAVLGYDL